MYKVQYPKEFSSAVALLNKFLLSKEQLVFKEPYVSAVKIFAMRKHAENLSERKPGYIYKWFTSKYPLGKNISLKYKTPKEVVLARRSVFPKEIPRYELFLKSDYWIIVKDEIKRRDDHKCVKCGYNRRLQVHHLSYAHHGDEMNHLEDLITVCPNCHKKIHGVCCKT